MKKKLLSAMTTLLLAFFLASCNSGQELEQFTSDIDSFCSSVASINDALNQIDADDENASQLALDYLDQLDKTFQDFAALDFPADYDVLEDAADEAGRYMTEAVEKYHQAFEGESYDEAAAAQARENSSKAFKQIQALLNALRSTAQNGDASSNNS